MAERDYGGRGRWHLKQASDLIIEDCSAMLAQHSAAGRLQSGTTLIRAAEIWSERSTAGVQSALVEFGSVVETRGREWRRAMAAILAAVEEHRLSADELLSPTLKAANPRGGSEGGAMGAVRQRLDDATVGLRDQIAAYGDGWTAPRPRKWNERHPIAFAIVMAVIGGVIALIARTII